MESGSIKLIRKLIHFTYVFTVVLFASGIFGKLFWLLDILSNFRVLFLFFFLAFTVLLYLANFKKLLVINGIIILFITFSLVKFYIPQKSTTSETSIKLSSINLEKSNSDINALESLMEQESPDILLLMEVTSKWMNKLNSTTFIHDYPYKITEPREGFFGMVMYSKIPYQSHSVISSGASNLPSIKVLIEINHQQVTVIGTHPPPPINKHHYELRNNQFKQFNQIIQNIETPIILLGDLNCTTHSPSLKLLTKNTNLKDSRIGKGLQPSWSIFNKSILPIAIDHAFVSKELKVLDRYVGKDINSDHLPIFVEIDF